MDMQNNDQETLIDNKADIELSKPSKSRFLFVLFLFSIILYYWAGCFNLWQHSYQEYNPEVPKNTLYQPEYK